MKAREGAPILVRWTLHRASGRVTETVLDARGNEFPRINGRRGGQACRYLYTARWGDNVAFRPGDEARFVCLFACRSASTAAGLLMGAPHRSSPDLQPCGSRNVVPCAGPLGQMTSAGLFPVQRFPYSVKT